MESSISTLPDPFGDRQIPEVDRPPNKPLSEGMLFPSAGKLNSSKGVGLTICSCVGADADKPNWVALKDFFLREGVVEKKHVVRILKALISLLSKFLVV